MILEKNRDLAASKWTIKTSPRTTDQKAMVKFSILSLGRLGSAHPLSEAGVAAMPDHVHWQHISLRAIEKWSPLQGHADFEHVLVDLDALEASGTSNEEDLKRWKLALNGLLQKLVDKNGNVPTLGAYTRQANWEKAQQGILIGARHLYKISELESFCKQDSHDDDHKVIAFPGTANSNRIIPPSGSLFNNEALNQIPSNAIPFPIEGMEGSSSAIEALRSTIRKVAPSKSSVLIMGPTGTGKERVARTLHAHSDFSRGPWVVVDCAAISPELFESEFFGHIEGAFTDAKQAREGALARANGGTLFIDQVHLLTPEQQAKLLRVLQEKHFTPVGSNESFSSDFRMICASQNDLHEMVRNGEFREDLFYRINVVDITLPALTERKADIPSLCDTFLKKLSKASKKPVLEVNTQALEKLLLYEWPGNVRELEHCMERACPMAWSDQRHQIRPSDLPETIQFAVMQQEKTQKLKDAVKRFEREYIAQTLRRLGGSKEETAEALGLSLATLYRKMGA